MDKNEKVLKEKLYSVHKAIPDMYTAFREGRVTRREFIRFSTLLGLSMGMATACSSPTPTGGDAEEAVDSTDSSSETASGSINRGGTLTIGMELQLIDHPARLSWLQGANIVRHIGEYLTLTDSNNFTTPFLLDSWSANDAADQWTLNLKRGIMFNNGVEMTADDVMFTFSQWLDPEIGSSMLGLLSYLDGMNSVSKVDDYTIQLDLTTPNVGVPENLFHYPGVILPQDFEGDYIRQPVGTGPFLLDEFVDGERAVFKAREDYWQMGEDGSPLPYLDELIYVSIDQEASVAGIQSGQIDTFYGPNAASWLALKDNPDLEVKATSTAQTIVLRTRVDLEPWNDVRVRNALRKVQNREKILQLSWFGEGDLGVDAHVAPAQPSYDPRPIPEYDPEGALALLEEWAADTGNELPIKATIVTKNDDGEQQYAEALKEDGLAGGFDFDLDITEAAGYWDRWAEVPLGITGWTHRPIATMLLPLAYIADADGVPVPWNETRFVDQEFMDLLDEASATVDIEARREVMGKIMDIFQERGPIGIAYWKSVWRIHRKGINNLGAHPTGYDLLNEVWLDPA